MEALPINGLLNCITYRSGNLNKSLGKRGRRRFPRTRCTGFQWMEQNAKTYRLMDSQTAVIKGAKPGSLGTTSWTELSWYLISLVTR